MEKGDNAIHLMKDDGLVRNKEYWYYYTTVEA